MQVDDAPGCTAAADEQAEASCLPDPAEETTAECPWQKVAHRPRPAAPDAEDLISQQVARMEVAAARRGEGELGAVAAACGRLRGLLTRALAERAVAAKPSGAAKPRKDKKRRANLGVRGGMMRWRPARSCAYAFAPIAPPPVPYAPLRWPPLRVTLAALRQGTAGGGSWTAPARGDCGDAGREGGPQGFVKYPLDPYLGLSEEFEDKVRVTRRHLPHGGNAEGGRHAGGGLGRPEPGALPAGRRRTPAARRGCGGRLRGFALRAFRTAVPYEAYK